MWAPSPSSSPRSTVPTPTAAVSRISAFTVRAYRAARLRHTPAVAYQSARALAAMGHKGRREQARFFARYAPDVTPVATLRLHYGNAPTGSACGATAWHGVPVTFDARRGMWVTHESRDGGVVVLAWHRTPGAAEAFAAGIACRRFDVPVEDGADDGW